MVAMTHNDPLPRAERHSLTLSSESRQAVNYYVHRRRHMDDVIAGYRKLTGKAPMMPKWAYGFWQIRQRYETQEQLLDVVAEYRKRGCRSTTSCRTGLLAEDAWGSPRLRQGALPRPARAWSTRCTRSNAHIMISVWPKFYPKTENYKELAAKGHIVPGNIEDGAMDWVGPGYTNTTTTRTRRRRATSTGARCSDKLVDTGRRRLVDGRYRAGHALQISTSDSTSRS